MKYMVEKYSFLINEADATARLPLGTGKTVEGLWRQVVITPQAPEYHLIQQLEVQSRGQLMGGFVIGWKCERSYSPAELQAAELFRMGVRRKLHSEAASHQSVYDLSAICSHCGAGRRQVQDLQIDESKLPKRRDIVYTLGKEWLIGERLARLLAGENFTGFRLRPLKHRADNSGAPIDVLNYPSGRELFQRWKAQGSDENDWRFPLWAAMAPQNTELWQKVQLEHAENLRQKEQVRKKPLLPCWYQLEITGSAIPAVAPTRFEINPFNEDVGGAYRCPLGHVSGLELLSEVWIRSADWNGSDVVATKNLIGQCAGYSVPAPLVLISARFHRFLAEHQVKGAYFEVAHLV